MFANLFDWAAGTSLIEFVVTWWLQSAVLISIGLAAAALIRRYGPARQSAVYRATLMGVLICPVLNYLIGQLEVQVVSIDLQSSLRSRLQVSEIGGELADSNVAMGPDAIVGASSPSMTIPSDPFTTFSLPPDPFTEVVLEESVDDRSLASSANPIAGEQNADAIPKGSIHALLYLVIASWVVGVTTLASRLGRDLIASRRLCGRSGDAGDSARTVCRDVADRLDVRQPHVRVTPFLASPCLFGHWNPTVFLPEATPESSYREVFLHELAHLRRGDWLWSVIGRGVRTLLWMQPLMWVLAKRTSIVAEEVCDDFVLEYGGDRQDYVQRLVEIAESRLPQRAVSGVAMVAFNSTLTQRVKRILDNTRELSTTVGRRFVVMALIMMLFATATVGLFDIGGPNAAAQQADGGPTTEATDEVKSTGAADSLVSDTLGSDSLGSDPFGSGGASDAGSNIEASNTVRLEAANTIDGRVLGPDGKPFADASLILERNQLHVTPRGYKHVIEIIDQARSAEDGTFHLDPGEHGRIGKTQIVASAKGLGVSIDLSFKDEASPTIQLVEDVPVEGRIVDTEGQPIEGAAVSVLSATPGKSDPAVSDWIATRKPELFKTGGRRTGFFYGGDPVHKTVFPGVGGIHQDSLAMPAHETVTNEDGRFRLTGFGRNRKLLLRIAGESIATDHALIVTREMKPFKAFDDRKSRLGFLDFTHHGATCNLVARPAQSIIGRLVDVDTGQPLGGELVSIRSYAGTGIGSKRGFTFTDSDDNGVFQFDGMPTGGGHKLRFLPPDDSPYFPTDLELPETDAPGPIECELRLAKARWIKGRVTNEDGDGIKAIMQYYPYRSNAAAEEYPNFDPIITGSAPNSALKTDDDGNFRIRAIEGEGIIGARVDDQQQPATYLSDVPKDLIDRMGGKRMGKVFTPWTYTWFHVMRDVEIAPGIEEIEFDLTVKQGKSHAIAIEGPNGEPVSGAQILGRVFPPKLETLENASAEVIGISDGDSRLVVVFHKDRKLGNSVVITSDNRPTRVRLQPCATLRGRLINSEQEPASEVDVRVTPLQDRDSWIRTISDVETTANGKFEVLLPPGNPYRVWHYDDRGPNFSVRLNPKPGAQYDVGDLKDGDELDESATSKRLEAGAKQETASSTLVTHDATQETPFIYEGQVLGPDNNPVAGARVYHVYGRQARPGNSNESPVAKTDAEGRFRFASNAATADDYFGGLIMVRSDGHAIAWVLATALEKTGALLEQFKQKAVYPRFAKLIALDQGPIRLLRDDVTVTGRLLDLEGNGIKGAIVSVEALYTGEDRTLDEWERVAASPSGHVPALQNTVLRTIAGPAVTAIFPNIETNQDGYFQIRGIGKDRIAKLVIRGENIEAILAYARTNNGPKRDVGFSSQSAEYWQRHYYGANLSLVASPARPIVGRITDTVTGEPLRGVVLTSMESYSQRNVAGKITHTRVGSREVIATTDADGTYRLDGLPPARRTPVMASLKAQGYLPREFQVDSRGLGAPPVKHDLQLSKGIRVSGRVTDAKTGKGITGSFRYLPKPTKAVSEHSLHQPIGYTGSSGEFSCLVPRDGGHLCFRASDRIMYPLVDTPKTQRTRLDVFSVGREFNLVKQIEIDPGQKSFEFDFSLTRLPTLAGTAVDPNGGPLNDLYFVGRSPQFSRWTPASNGEIEIIRIEKAQTRKVAVYHRGKALSGMTVLTSDSPSDFQVKTQPWATLTGRLVDEDGAPFAGVKIYSSTRRPESFSTPHDAMMKHDFSRSPLPLPPADALGNRNHHTDRNGRFVLVGVVPGYSYNLNAILPSSLRQLDSRLVDDVVLKSGETRDLGDIVLRETVAK